MIMVGETVGDRPLCSDPHSILTCLHLENRPGAVSRSWRSGRPIDLSSVDVLGTAVTGAIDEPWCPTVVVPRPPGGALR